MSSNEYIIPIPEIESMILDYLDSIEDVLNLFSINKYFSRIVSINKIYLEFIKFHEVKNHIHDPNSLDYAGKEIKLFWKTCIGGYLFIMKYLLAKKKYSDRINIRYYWDYAFRLCCVHGHLEMAKWLHQFSLAKNNLINIHSASEYAFRWSCRNGHLDIAKWLYQLSQTTKEIIDIHINSDYIFKKCCRYRRLDVVEWLCSIHTPFVLNEMYVIYIK